MTRAVSLVQTDPRTRAAELSCWSGPVDPQPLGGGITNTNFTVHDDGERYVVRIGDDLPLHGVLRVHELTACRAAHACGLAPEIVHHAPGALVMRFVEGATLTDEAVRDPHMLPRLVDVIRRCHTEMPHHLRGATPMFWVFQVCRGYLATAEEGDSRLAAQLPAWSALNGELEAAVGPIRPVFSHNDLLPANFIDDGDKIWLLDWEYAGWNTPLFDLANLASNCGFAADQEAWVLEQYFGATPDATLLRRYYAVVCASLLRETLWSVVQEIHATLDFDFAAYTDENQSRLERAYAHFATLP